MRPAALSVSSDSSVSSTSSSRDRKVYVSPRKSILSTCSPPPSPSLPSLLHRHGSKDRRRGRRLTHHNRSWKNISFTILCVLTTAYLFTKAFLWFCQPIHVPVYELEDRIHLPDDPTALIVHDDRGRKKWTVWIPETSRFPLRPWQYREICGQVDDIRRDLGRKKWFGRKGGHYGVDGSFVDVDKAISIGLLPHQEPMDDTNGRIVCKRSLTFVMETNDVGMGNSLLALWLAYGLAKKESRAFFVDDSRWVYGNYTSYFKSPPDQGCDPPPANYRLPCSTAADHVVISQATFSHSFGDAFMKEFVDKSRCTKTQHHRIYDLMRRGYEDLFQLADDQDARYVQQRIINGPFKTAKDRGGMTIGLHIRRGDNHPWTVEFHGDYLPLSRYMDEVRSILSSTYGSDQLDDPFSKHPGQKSSQSVAVKTKHRSQSTSTATSELLSRLRPAAVHNTAIFLSSDDPTLYTNPDLQTCIRSQDRIHLADKATLRKMGAKPHGPLDTLNGWEGGFFKDVFLALGRKDEATPKPPPRLILKGRNVRSKESSRFEHDTHVPDSVSSVIHHDSMIGLHYGHQDHEHEIAVSKVSADTLALRVMIGRAYLLDLAVLGKTDAVVCAVGSAACRILGVMMGWDAVKDGLWRDVDGGHGWVGIPGLRP